MAYLFARQKIMELLQKTYSDQRAQYSKTLKEALKERNPEKMQVYSKTLVELNQQMSATVSSMVSLVAQTESKVNLDALRDKLLAELVGIQKDITAIQESYGERKVLQSIHDQYSYQNSRNDWTILAYMIALGIGILLVVLAILNVVVFSPAMPPIASVSTLPRLL